MYSPNVIYNSTTMNNGINGYPIAHNSSIVPENATQRAYSDSSTPKSKMDDSPGSSRTGQVSASTAYNQVYSDANSKSSSRVPTERIQKQYVDNSAYTNTPILDARSATNKDGLSGASNTLVSSQRSPIASHSTSHSTTSCITSSNNTSSPTSSYQSRTCEIDDNSASNSSNPLTVSNKTSTNVSRTNGTPNSMPKASTTNNSPNYSEPSHVKNAYMGETTIGSRETNYNPDSSTFSTYASPSIPVQTPVVKNTESSLSPHTSSHVPKSDQTTTETLCRTYDSPNVSTATATTRTHTKPRSTPSPRSPPYSKSAATLQTTQQENRSSSTVPAVVPIKNDKRSNESRSTLPQPHASPSSPPLFPVMVEDEELLDPSRMSVNVVGKYNTRAHTAHTAHTEESSGSRRAPRSAANSRVQQHVDVDSTSSFAANRVTTQSQENVAVHSRQDMSSKSNPISRGTTHINANEGKVYGTSYNNTTTTTTSKTTTTSLPSSPPAFPVVVEDEEPISSIPFKGVDEPRTRYNKPRHPSISKSGTGTVNESSGNYTLTSATTTTSTMASNEGTTDRARARARGIVPPRLASTDEPISQLAPSISTSTAAEKNLVINGLSEMKEEAEAGVNRSKKAGKGEPTLLGRDRNEASSPNLPSTTSSTNISKISTSFSTSSSGQPKSPNQITNRSYPPQINSASIDVNTSAPIAPSSSSSSSSPTVPTAPAPASASYSVIKTSSPPSASSSTSSSAVSSPHTTGSGSSSGSSSTSLPASDTSDQVAAESSKSTTAGLDGYVGKSLEGDLNSATKPSVRIAGSKKTENEVPPKRLREGSGDSSSSLTNPGSKPSIISSSHEVKSDSGSQNTTKNDTQNNKVARQLSSKHDNERKQPDRENKLSSLPSVPPKVSLPSSPKASLPSKNGNGNGNTHSSSKSTSSTSKSTSLPIKHTPLPPPPPSLNIYGSRRTGTPLQVIVVGGGIGGLSVAFTLSQSGHSVTILESAKRLGEVGAGLQISPNVSRLLMRWGCGEGISSNSGKPTSGANNYGTVGSESRINERLSSCAVEPEALVFRRYDDGSIVGRSEWGEKVRSEFGAPYLHMHRADLHQILLDNVRASSASSREESDNSTTGAAPRGEGGRVSFRLNSRVQRIDPFPSAERNKVAVELKTGEVYEADLIVGADGVHSLVRETVVGRLDLAQRTGDAAYRAVISTDRILELSYELDARERQEGVQRGEGEDLRRLIDNPEMTTWMGPGRHIMAYCIRAKREYNLVMLYPDDKAEESKYTAEGSVEKMNAEFANFEPRIKHLLSLVEKPLVWRLDEREALHTWVHPAGRVVLLGDACHPMLPYRAQGAAMAIEDAAVIGNLLSRLTGPTGPSQNILSTGSGSQSQSYSGRSQSTPTATPLVYAHLTELLHSYERLRLKRTKRTQEMSRLNRYIFHLPDGPEQDARDSSMRRAMKAEEKEREREREKTSNAASQDGSSTSGVEEKGKNLANANQWADGAKNKEQYAYDADEVVADWWKREGEDRLRILLQAHGLCDSNGRSERGEDSERGTMRSNGSRSSDGGGGGGGGGKKGFWKKVFGASKKDHGSED